MSTGTSGLLVVDESNKIMASSASGSSCMAPFITLVGSEITNVTVNTVTPATVEQHGGYEVCCVIEGDDASRTYTYSKAGYKTLILTWSADDEEGSFSPYTPAPIE